MSGVDVAGAKNAILQAMQPKEPSEEQAVLEGDGVSVSEDTQQEAVEHEDVVYEDNVEESSEDAANGDAESVTEQYKVKVQGEEREVSLDELRSGYMMGADYTQKTQDLSKQKETIQKQQQELALKLEDAQTLLKLEIEDFDSEEMKELKEYDPEAFYQKKELLEGKVKRFNELRETVSKQQQEATQARLQKEGELLLQAIPEWVDQDVAKKDVALIQDYWKSLGITEEDQNGEAFQDHRFVKMSLAAAKYANINSSKPIPKKVPPKPKTTRPVSANEIPSRKEQATAKSKNRVSKTGKVRDGAAAIRDLMNKGR